MCAELTSTRLCRPSYANMTQHTRKAQLLICAMTALLSLVGISSALIATPQQSNNEVVEHDVETTINEQTSSTLAVLLSENRKLMLAEDTDSSVVEQEPDNSEEETDDYGDNDEMFDGDDSDSRRLATCTHNLKGLSQYTISTSARKYEVVRQRRNSYGNGPARYVRNKLPAPFNKPSCQAIVRPRRLTFRLNLSKGDKRHIGSCIGHHGSHTPEYPTIALYDCNGNELACGNDGSLTYTHNATRQDVLVVVTTETDRRPDAYMFLMQKRKQISSVWCDYFPF